MLQLRQALQQVEAGGVEVVQDVAVDRNGSVE